MLNTNEVRTALFAKGQKVESDIDLCVGDKAVSAEVQATFVMVKNLGK